jgi:cohesin loading factor subunit SCC2
MDRLSEEVGSVQSLKSLFLPILNVVLVALDAPPVFMRTKALRALGQIVTSDPSILSMVRLPRLTVSHPNPVPQSNVRSAIEIHLLDHSTAVRDAAVDLIGKYMIDSPVVAREYYPRVAERVAVRHPFRFPDLCLIPIKNRTLVSLYENA